MMISNRLKFIGFCICSCLMMAVDAFAYTPSELKSVRIELRYDLQEQKNEIGATHTKTIVPYTYFMLTDLYTDDEIKVSSDSYKDAVTVFEFELNHPLYDCIISGGNVKIPFYVEPGDTLIINLTKNGKVLSYKDKDGKDARYKSLLMHDFSNNVLYTDKQYDEDKKDATFPIFIERVTKRMYHSLDSLDIVAKKYSFSIEERQIAADNIMVQYAKWMFQFAPYKPQSASNYSAESSQSTEKGSDIADIKNYDFYRQLPFDDSLCIASRYFPKFMNSYEHTYFLNSDKALYNGTSLHAQARMDSAFVSKDMQITGLSYPSFFMEMAMIRRHFDPSAVDDGSVRLHEVKVIGRQNVYYKPVTPEDMIKWRDNQKTTAESFVSPSYWLFERKKQKSKKRAKALIDKIAEEDDAKNSERDELLKAYEEETGHKYEDEK